MIFFHKDVHTLRSQEKRRCARAAASFRPLFAAAAAVLLLHPRARHAPCARTGRSPPPSTQCNARQIAIPSSCPMGLPLHTTRDRSVLDAPMSRAIDRSYVSTMAAAFARETSGTNAIISTFMSLRASFTNKMLGVLRGLRGFFAIGLGTFLGALCGQ